MSYFYLFSFALLIYSVSPREITSRQLDEINNVDSSDTVVIESETSFPSTTPDEEASDRNDNFPYETDADGEEDDSDGLGSAFKAFVDAAAIVELLSDDEEDNEEEEEEVFDHPNTKNYGFLAQFNPGQFLAPIGDKIAAFGSGLNRPNGFALPRPIDLWSKLQQTSSNFFSGANSAIFGLGQTAGHDYPFPYRASNGRSLRDELLNYGSQAGERISPDVLARRQAYWKDRLGAYKEPHVEKNVGNRTTKSQGVYYFPYLLGADRIKEFAQNSTGN